MNQDLKNSIQWFLEDECKVDKNESDNLSRKLIEYLKSRNWKIKDKT